MSTFKVGDWVVRNDFPYGPNNPKFRQPCQITSIVSYPDDWGDDSTIYIRFWGATSGWSPLAFKRCMPPNTKFNPDDYL